jgi:hypothetical protein
MRAGHFRARTIDNLTVLHEAADQAAATWIPKYAFPAMRLIADRLSVPDSPRLKLFLTDNFSLAVRYQLRSPVFIANNLLRLRYLLRASSEAQGVCFTTWRPRFITMRPMGAGREAFRVLCHELTHALTPRAHLFRWLQEGIAELVSYEYLGQLGYDDHPIVPQYARYYWKARFALKEHESVTLRYLNRDVGHVALVNAIAGHEQFWLPGPFEKFVETATLRAFPELVPIWDSPSDLAMPGRVASLSDLISVYVFRLEAAVEHETDAGGRFEYLRQLGIAREMQVEYQASASLDELRERLLAQRMSWQMAYLSVRSAEYVRGAFAELCRAAGVS